MNILLLACIKSSYIKFYSSFISEIMQQILKSVKKMNKLPLDMI